MHDTSPSPKVVRLLGDLIDGRAGRSSLARWLATQSLPLLESENHANIAIVADLDAALGEVQRGTQADAFLAETAAQLVEMLHLDVAVSP